MNNKEFFSWRHCVISSDLYSVTKHVLLTLSCYYSESGQGVFPNTQTLAQNCSLSERAVITHIANAATAGWVKVSKHGFGDQRWRRNEYKLTLPDGYLDEMERKEALNDVQHDEEKALNVVQKGTERGSEGTERDDKEALNVVQSNTPIGSTPKKTPKNKRCAAPSDMALPAWLPKGSWDNYDEMRRGMTPRVPWTDRAKNLLIAKIFELRKSGEDPEELLDTAVINGWRSVYPTRKNGNHGLFNEERDGIMSIPEIPPVRD